MKALLTSELKARLPDLYEQELATDPIVHAKFFFPGGSWIWFVTEGRPQGDDFLFFGYVIGMEAEWGYFSLKELEDVNISGWTIERDQDFKPAELSLCLLGLAASIAEKLAANQRSRTRRH